MSNVVKRITALIKDTQSMEEAVKVLTGAFDHISTKEAENTVKDVLEFSKGEMKESELEHWLKDRGITA